MAHSRAWDDTDPGVGDNLGDGYAAINNLSEDVSERMALEHIWATSTTTDGLHVPGSAGVVQTQGTAAQIIANAGAYLAAYNGSMAVASDTAVAYVKKGAASATNGTWTAVTTTIPGFGDKTLNDSLANALVKAATYKAEADGFVMANADVAALEVMQLKSDANATPVLTVAYMKAPTSHGMWLNIMAPIQKDDYWTLSVTSATPAILWMPVGTGNSVKQ